MRRYRLQQVVAALAAHVSPPDDTAARRVLPPPLQEVFAAMPAADRRHGLAVLKALEEEGHAAPPLLEAALLHDAGKAGAGVRLPHRVARVLLSGVVPRVWARLSDAPTGWRRPFWVVANHPARGAVWVATCGGSRELVCLIRYHERDAPASWRGTDLGRWHAALAAVDARL